MDNNQCKTMPKILFSLQYPYEILVILYFIFFKKKITLK